MRTYLENDTYIIMDDNDNTILRRTLRHILQ